MQNLIVLKEMVDDLDRSRHTVISYYIIFTIRDKIINTTYIPQGNMLNILYCNK